MGVDETDVTVLRDILQWTGSSRCIYPSLSQFLIIFLGHRKRWVLHQKKKENESHEQVSFGRIT